MLTEDICSKAGSIIENHISEVFHGTKYNETQFHLCASSFSFVDLHSFLQLRRPVEVETS